ncbi:MAG: CHAT domain-containing protein [Bacteroidia bacterium]|nr:CHAT domain-containing protein [Bacteroidia bacterium]
MKTLFYLILIYSVLFISAQTWQSAYDSCLKYQEKQQYKKAIEWGDKALELYEKQIQVKDTMYSNILNKQVENCYYGGFYSKGVLYAQKDSIWSKEKNAQKYSNACNNLAILYQQQGKYIEAEILLKESKQIDTKILGTYNSEYATVCDNLGLLYLDMGRLTEAECLFKESMQIRTKILGKEHIDYATSCNNLALLYHIQAKYSDAEILYKEAQKIRAKNLGKKHPLYASSCNNLAELYKEQGRYEEAEQLYKETIQIHSSVLGEDHPDYAISCNNLGSLYQEQGKYTEAEILFKNAKEISMKTLGKEHPHYAASCNNLAILYVNQKKYIEAETLYKESKHILSKTVGKEHPNYASACNSLGEVLQAQGRYTQAESSYKEARKVWAKSLGTFHPHYANSCINMASLYQNQGKYEQSESLYKEALSIKLKEIQSNFRNLSESEKEKYIQANINQYFNSFQLFVLKRYLQNPAITQESYNLVLQTKGLILQSTEKIKNRIFNSQNEELKKLYVEWKLTKDRYAKAENITINERKQKKINLDSLAQQANELEKQLALKSEDFAHTFVPKQITWKDIQKVLQKHQAAIEIVRVKASKDKDSVVYFGLVITKWSKYPELVLLPYGNMLEKELFINYYRSTRHKIIDPYSYAVFWKPFVNKFKGIKQVFFSPDGIYYKINIATLYNTEQNKYVFDEIKVVNVTSTKDLVERHKRYAKKSFLVGNPVFNLGIDTKDNQKPIEQRSIEDLSPLEGAEKEVKQIAMFLPDATTIIGIDATEECLKSIKNPRILHIATHGYFKKGEYQSSTQAMLNAGLLLAGVVDYDKMEMRPLDREDGKLTAFEVMNMELDSTELVVLSACETGLGQASKEGVYGLQRAFKVAGAQSIIMSLWKVNDEATQLLMTRFYENWQKKGMTKRKAFETAQKEIRKWYKEPYYWGAFVMIE